MNRRSSPPSGRYTVYDIDESGFWHPMFSCQNTLMVSWGFAAAKLFGSGDRNYRINRMYIEFENVSAPEDVVAVPAYDSLDSRLYYDNLSSPRDYLRVPLVGTPEMFIASGYEDHFTEGVNGNALRFFAQTSGIAGVNGLTFSDSVNSKVFGVALAACPVAGDRTQDVLISRGYFATAHQQLKTPSAQIGVSWELQFTPD